MQVLEAADTKIDSQPDQQTVLLRTRSNTEPISRQVVLLIGQQDNFLHAIFIQSSLHFCA